MARIATPRRTLVVGATAAVVAALLAPGAAFAAAKAAEPGPQRVGTAPTAPAGATRTGNPAADTPLDLSVTLKPRDPGALQSFVTAVSDPKSSQYRKYLKTGEFAQRFGADPATAAQVSKALSAAGLHPGALAADGLTIPVHTTMAEAGRALDTDFNGYRLGDGSSAYANTRAPKLPGSIAPRIAGLTGLNSLAKPHAHHTSLDQAAAAAPTAGSSRARTPQFSSSAPMLCQGVRDWQAQSYNRQDYRDYFSTDALAQVYNTPFSNGGAGTTVALFELEDYNDAAIQSFQDCYGTQTPVSRVKVKGGPTVAPTLDNHVGEETALDIETVVGLAPNSNILVYQGPDTSTTLAGGDSDTLSVLQQIVGDNRAQVVSISWGECEAQAVQDSGFLQAENLVFQQAAAQGQTVVAASGDSGSSGCYQPGTTDPLNSALSVDDPASQPYVTGVGGTSITGWTTGTFQQPVWNSNGGAGGGGVSSVWSLDSATGYQAGPTGPGYSNACNAPTGRTCRQVPDVSALADPGQGYLVATFVDANGTWWKRIGGTSGAAPVWAAIVAQFDSDSQCAANGPLGFINPSLYKLKSSAVVGDGTPIRDVTSGNNTVSASGYTGSLYAAGSGYDLASGLGAPNAGAMLAPVCAAAPATPAGTYKPVAPSRLLDTRGTPVPAYGTKTLQITGQGGVPSSGVTAAVINVTVTNTTTDGHLTVFPSDGANPSTSNLNWTAGKTIPNLVTVPVGKDGAVKLYNGTWGNTDLIVDVQGYYTADTSGATYQATGPTRVLDTRSSSAIPAYGSKKIQIAGVNNAPAGVSAVVANVTVTNTTTDGHLTVFPTDLNTPPTASNLNWTAGTTIPNQVIVPVGKDGSIILYNGAWGSTDVIVDVAGYLTSGNAGASFHSTTPHRLFDSRTGQGNVPIFAHPLSANETHALALTGPLANAKAVVLNVTVTNTTTDGHLTVFPYNGQNSTVPTASNLNWTAGETIPNMVTVPVGQNGAIDINNGAWGNTDVIVDIFGYYS